MNIPQAMARAARCAVRILTGGAFEPTPSRWSWPPLDDAPTAARIAGERAEDAWARRQGLAVPYSPDPAVCEAACEEWIGTAAPEQGPTLSRADADALAEADTPE